MIEDVSAIRGILLGAATGATFWLLILVSAL